MITFFSIENSIPFIVPETVIFSVSETAVPFTLKVRFSPLVATSETARFSLPLTEITQSPSKFAYVRSFILSFAEIVYSLSSAITSLISDSRLCTDAAAMPLRFIFPIRKY